jgi:RNA polymerase sigma factor (sigma-70 family)
VRADIEKGAEMPPVVAPSSCAHEVLHKPDCLLSCITEVCGVLWRKGFPAHAIENAMTAVYVAVMPYLKGGDSSHIENPRAWVYRVALNAAIHAGKRELARGNFDPARLPARVNPPDSSESLFDIDDVLSRLTQRQRTAVELCLLENMSLRTAAREMGISVGTLCGHLSAAKEHLKGALAPFRPRVREHAVCEPCAHDSFLVCETSENGCSERSKAS